MFNDDDKKYNYKLPLYKFPFLTEAKEVLQRVEITQHELDNTNTFDDIIRKISNEIIDVIGKKPYNDFDWSYTTNEEYEITKFYITMVLLSKMPTIIIKHYIRYYIDKIKTEIGILTSSMEKDMEIKIFYYTLVKLINPKYELEQIDWLGYHYFGIKVPIYLSISSTITDKEYEEYVILRMINLPIYHGSVLFPMKDYYLIELLTCKLIENLINDSIQKIDNSGFQSAKLDKCKDEIIKYLTNKISIKLNDYNSKEYKLVNEVQLKENAKIAIDELKENVTLIQFPPCINNILTNIDNKKVLGYAENILLCSYLSKKGFTFDQIIDIFKKTINYNEKISKTNINSIIEKQLIPMNCSKLEAEQLCYRFLDKSNKCNRIKNPLTF